MRNCAPLPLALLLACVPLEPPGTDPATSVTPSEFGTSGGSGTTGWPLPARERDKAPSSTTTSATTTSSGPPPLTSDGGDASDTGTGPPLDLSALQIAELHPDPDGKDGGPDSPEFIELLHVGELPIDLAGLEIDARAWPTLRADALGFAGQMLLPGERLLVLRFAATADVPDPPVAPIDGGLRVAFAYSEGLRNADGGVLLRVGDVVGDAVIHGAPQPAPWDARGLWIGAPAPAPGSGESLCRGPAIDHDDASDWSVCPPSAGAATELEAGTTGDEGGTTGEALPAEVAIVEVLSNPPGPGNLEKHAEFVEIENLGPGPVDLATWTIADDLSDAPTGADPLLYLDGDGGCLPSTCLAPGQRAIIVGNLYTGPTGAGLVLVTDDTTIANAGLAVHEPVALRDGSKLLRSTYRAWPDPLVAPDPAATEEALVRGDPAAPDLPEAWSFAAPTPGL